MTGLGELRSIADDELELMLAWRNAPGIRANMYTRQEITLDEHLAWWQRTRARDDLRYFMYEYLGRPSGIVGLTAIDLLNANCSWAFYADPQAPKGTGVRMECLALEHVFGVLGLHKLYCEVLAFNAPVIRLHQKFGFQTEGIFRQHHHHPEQGYVDIHRLGLLREEWAIRRDDMLAKATVLLKS